MAWGTPTVGTATAVASGNVTPSLPTHSEGDILIGWLGQKDVSTPSCTGWTFYESDGDGVMAGWFFVKDTRAGASESNPTITRTGTTNSASAHLMAVSGGLASGDPVDAFAASTDTAGTSSLPTLDPTTDDCMIFYGLAANDDGGLTTDLFTTPDGTGPTFTELRDFGSSLGTDHCAACGYGEHSGNAATGARSVTRAAGARVVHAIIALKPAVGGGGGDPSPLDAGKSLAAVGAGR